MVGAGEIGFDFHQGMLREFPSVVEGDGFFQEIRKGFQESIQRVREPERVLSEREEPREGVSGFPFDHGKDSSLVIPSYDGVAFPVPGYFPSFDFFRTGIDHLAIPNLVFSERFVFFPVPVLFPLPPEIGFHETRGTFVYRLVERVFREGSPVFKPPPPTGLFRGISEPYPAHEPFLQFSSRGNPDVGRTPFGMTFVTDTEDFFR